jgi:hypothetical protein
MIRALTAAAILASFVFAVPAHAEQKIKPEMIIQFTKGTIACLSRDSLQEIMLHGLNGEATKMRAMMIDEGGDCLMLDPKKRVRVISAEYNSPDSDIGILEVVGEDKVKLNGAWALSVGAEEVTTPAPASAPRKKAH